jgi:predicted dehydrogenase
MSEVKSVLFVGLGGAGQRHLRVVKKFCPEAKLYAYRTTSKTPLLTPGFEVDSNNTVESQYGVELVEGYEQGLAKKPDLVVISTPSSLHMSAALKAVEAGSSLLVEKPFSHNLEGFSQLKQIAEKKNLLIATSYQRRYNQHFETVKKAIGDQTVGKISSVVFNVSSYLPVWHKYEDFRDMYAARPELGGGALLTEIHEIDLCTWFFGLPQTVYCAGGSLSGADLQVEDTVAVVLNYGSFVVSLNIGFMNRKTRKEMQLYGSKVSFEWVENQNILKTFRHESNKEDSVSAPFQGPDELFEKQFQDLLKRGLRYSAEDFNKAEMSVRIVEAAKASMKSGQAVRI